jgi:menaquinone-9 beta-reductase
MRINVAAQVVVLDKETFPRDKYCGDAVCTPAIRILDDMGVMKALAENNESHFADAGGFVSPSGLSYIGEQQAAGCGEVHACAAKYSPRP